MTNIVGSTKLVNRRDLNAGDFNFRDTGHDGR
jgi:hypothetical protein